MLYVSKEKEDEMGNFSDLSTGCADDSQVRILVIFCNTNMQWAIRNQNYTLQAAMFFDYKVAPISATDHFQSKNTSCLGLNNTLSTATLRQGLINYTASLLQI